MINRKQRAAKRSIAWTLSGLMVMSVPPLAHAQTSPAPTSLSVPAEFIRFVTPPGRSNEFLRPSAIVVDSKHDEVLIADPGHNRIVIFDASGAYRFEFGGTERFAAPIGLAVDSEGYIYVLGSTARGQRLFRFDWDGTFIEEVALDYAPEGERIKIQNIAIDGDDRLIVIDRAGFRVCTYARDGELLGTFPIAEELEEDLKRETVLGSMTVRGDLLLIPIPTLGSVYLYTRAGEFVRSIGYKGTNVGEMNFPVAVAVTNENLVLVLDKHRYNVVCFDLTGKFWGEFGGKGSSPGWFYHPSLLAVDGKNQVYVGQIFLNRVQTCRIPDFIVERHRRANPPRAPGDGQQTPSGG
jgi:DNA-binding beta-propeller fold protein YncE